MKEKPIIFSGEMVRAILESRKTQTRRVIKPQPPSHHVIAEVEDASGFWSGIPVIDGMVPVKQVECPYEVGMCLWVRETHCLNIDIDGDTGKHAGVCAYRADCIGDHKYHFDYTGFSGEFNGIGGHTGWQSSTFMPRWASRVLLEITEVKVEQVQDISRHDAKAEGIFLRYEFRKLWDKINKKRGFGWDVNPWVWKLSFRVLEPKEVLDGITR